MAKVHLGTSDSVVANDMLVAMCISDPAGARKFFRDFGNCNADEAKDRVNTIIDQHRVAIRGEELVALKDEVTANILETIQDNEIPEDVAELSIHIGYTKGEKTLANNQVVAPNTFYVVQVTATLADSEKTVTLSKIAKTRASRGGGARRSSVPIPDGADFKSWKERADQLSIPVGRGSAARALEKARDEVYLAAKAAAGIE